MKRRGLSLLLVVTLILSLFMFCTTAFAASNAENGLSAELITDKTEYTAGEEVGITLKVKNASPYVSNIWARLVLPEVLKLKQGDVDSGVIDLEINGEEEFTYTADTPAPSTTTAAPTTTVAGTTVTPTTGNPSGPSDTGDVSLYIFGALALFSLIGLVVVLGGFKAVLKSRWFVLVLCLAMLVSVTAPLAASAAVTQKFFDVTTTVKVDGVDTEIKATITYDFDDGIYPASEVEFKADGESLYNLVGEMGWFTPCNSSIKVDGVAASNTSRPEVEASYISMLFGCINTKTNTFVPGILDNSQIISEDAEKELLVGRTEDKASLKALDLIGQDEWIIAEIDGKIVVTGWYDNATVAAVQHLYNLVKDQDDVTLQLPIKGDVDGYIADIPDLEDGTFFGGMDSSEGAVILRYSIEDVAAFEAYAEKLEDEGYSLYAENEIAAYGGEKHLFATYVKGDSVVHVSYFSDSFMEADTANLTANEKEYYKRSFRPIGKEIRIVIDSKAALFTNAANNDYTDLGIKPKVSVVNLYNKVGDGNNNAECLIYTLADGSFIIVDGGFAQDADQVFRALTELNERPDGKIVVAAWFMSHHHGDHVGAFKAMADKEYAKDIYIEQFIYNPTAVTYNWRSMNAPFNYSMDFNYSIYNHEYMSGLLAKFGDGDTQIVNPHVGQRMMIRNAEVEFIFTGDEDLFPIHIDNTNDTSMVFSVNFKGKDGEADSSMMVLNDSCVDSQYGWIMPLFSQAMDCDIVQVAHHGLGGPSTALYRMMEPIVAIWCSTESTAIKNNWFVEKDGGGSVGGSAGFLLYRKADDTNKPVALRMLAEHHVQTLVLPYKAGDPVIKRNLGTYKSNFFELNKVKLVTVGAGQFGGDLESCLADVAEYLLAENADVLGITEVTADQVETLAKALGYPYYSFAPENAAAQNAIGNLLLSRYPIMDEKLYEVDGNGVGIVVLDVEGIRVDVAYMDIDSADALDEVPAPNHGDYQVIMGVLNAPSNSQYAAVQNNLRENIYVTTSLASGAPLTGGKLEDAAEATGCDAMDKLVSVTATLSRKHLIEDFDEGSFDDVPTVAIWWANYIKDLNNKEQVLTWILKNKPEILGLDHMPLELLSDEGAAEFAQLAGYEYFAWTRKHTVNDTTAYGQLLLSHYPMEDVGTVILRDIGAAGGEGRRYLRATVTMPGGEKVDVYVGDTDGGATRAEQLATLEAAVKARSEANNGRDFFILSCDAAIPAEFAGKTMKVYNGDGSYIAISGNYPMDGMRTYGTKAYPHDGRSPIGTTLPNIDKYSKVELAVLPKYALTVNGGTGSGEFIKEEEVYAMAATPGKGMVFAGWTAEGITLEDPMAMEQVFEMPANTVKLTATYEAIAFTERLETGDNSNELKVAVLPVYRFQGKFAIFQNQILENIRSINADVLAVTIVDYDASVKLNTTIDVVPTLKEALADLYQYSFFAPATKVGTPSDTDPGAGYVGHLLLSKYPILSNETIELNTEPSEVRMVGHSIINVGTESEPTRLGVYYSHLGNGSNWTSGKQNLYDVVASANEDAYVMIGKFHYTDNKATIAQKLGTTVAAKDANLTIFGSENITVKADSYGENTVLQDAFTAAGYNTIEKLYYATVSMPLYEDGDTRYPVNITADGETAVDGWYAEGATVTIVAPDAPAGYKFDGWTLPTGLVLTEGTTAADTTIKFTMPAAIVDLGMAYAENPTGTVEFNVNGGVGTLADVTANVGDYTLPAKAEGILSPAGKKFAGWGLTATATKADAVDTAVVTKNEKTTVYAIWEDTDEVDYLTWWVSLTPASGADKVKQEILRRDPDIVALVSTYASMTSDGDMQAYAESFGYPYAYYQFVAKDTNNGNTDRGNIILSKFELTKKGNDGLCYWYDANINGTHVDVYAGYDCNGKENYIKGNAAITGNDYVLIGHTFGALLDNATYAGKNIAGVNGNSKGWKNIGVVTSLNAWTVVGTPAPSDVTTPVGGNASTYVCPLTVRLKNYTVSFDAGEGSGNQAPIYTDGGNTALPATTTFTAPTGKVFAGWSETAGGAVISGNSINVTGDKTLYAVWESAFSATVTGGTGSGKHDVGTTVTVTADAALEGKVFSYWEGLEGVTLAEGYTAVSSTLKFTMPGKNVTLTAVYRDEGKIRVATMSTGRFMRAYSSSKETIHNNLLSIGADVIVLHQIDEGVASDYGWNHTDVATQIAKGLKHEYPYSYFAPVWACDADANATTGDGYIGSLILSRFLIPAENAEAVFMLQDGVETRGGGHVMINVDGVDLDLYFAHMGKADCWTQPSLVQNLANRTGDAVVVMGDLRTSGATSYIANVLPNYTAVWNASQYDIVGQNVTFSNRDNSEKTLSDAGLNCSAVHAVTVTLPTNSVSISFDNNGGYGTMPYINMQAGTYTLPANGFLSPAGKVFAGWSETKDGTVISGTSIPVNSDKTLYAVWQDNPNGYKVYGQWVTMDNATRLNALVSDIRLQNADIVGFTSMKLTAANHTYEFIQNSLGYPYAKWIPDAVTAGRGNLILSKFPLSDVKASNPVLQSSGANAYCSHLTTTIDGKTVDLFVGFDSVGKSETFIKGIVDESGNGFIIIGHSMSNVTTWAGKPVTNVAPDNTNRVVISTDKITVTGTEIITRNSAYNTNANTNIAIANFAVKANITFATTGAASGSQTGATVYVGESYTLPTSTTMTAPAGKAFAGWASDAEGTKRITKLENITANTTVYPVWASTKIMSWWVNNLGSNNTYASEVMNAVKEEGAGIVCLVKVKSRGDYTSAQAIANATGYPYVHYVEFSNSTFQGHIILSQFPLTAHETLHPSTTASEALGHCSVLINGKPLHLFAGTNQENCHAAAEKAVKDNLPAGEDFIFFYHHISHSNRNLTNATTYADRNVTVRASSGVNTGMIASTGNMTYSTVNKIAVPTTKIPSGTGIEGSYLTTSFS